MLKQFKWRSDFIDILNIPFGSKQEIFRVFLAKISSVKNKVLRSKKIHYTFDAKSVIVKMKILPLLSFFSQVYFYPNSMIFKLTQIQFLVYLHEKFVDLGLNLENTGPNCRNTNNMKKVERKKQQQHY